MHRYLDVIEELGEKINVAEQQSQKLFEKDDIFGFIILKNEASLNLKIVIFYNVDIHLKLLI